MQVNLWLQAIFSSIHCYWYFGSSYFHDQFDLLSISSIMYGFSWVEKVEKMTQMSQNLILRIWNCAGSAFVEEGCSVTSHSALPTLDIPFVDFETSWEEEAQRQPSRDSTSQHGHQASQEMSRGGDNCPKSHSSILLSSSAFEGLVFLHAANTEKIFTPTRWKQNILLFCPQG